MNYHFGDKEQLYVQAVLQAHRCGTDPEDDGPPSPSPSPPAEQLRCFIHHFLTRVLAVQDPDDWRHRLMHREMLHPTKAFDVLLAETIRPRFEKLRGILRELCPEADDQKLNALAFSVIGQCFHYRVSRAFIEGLVGREALEALDRDYLTEHITTFCLAALVPHSDPPASSPGRSPEPPLGQAGAPE